MFVQMNLRLARELLRLAEYLHDMDEDTVYIKKLITEGHVEAYLLCDYLGKCGFVHHKGSYIGVSPDVRESMLNHTKDLVRLHSGLERDRIQALQDSKEALKVGRESLKVGHEANLLSKSTAKWNKWSIAFTVAVAAGQIAQWILMIFRNWQ